MAGRASVSSGSTGSRAERVQVFCRVRPLLQRERDGWSYDQYAQQYPEPSSDANGCHAGSLVGKQPPPESDEASAASCFLTEKVKISLDSSVLRLHKDSKTLTHSAAPSSTGGDKEFAFDASLHEGTGQQDVYDRVARDIVQDVLNGFNGTVLAYGQTSTGKTYTMLGKDDSLFGDHRGIIPRAFEDIFEHANQTRALAKTTVALSYVQVYCERIFDLLEPSTPHGSLMVRDDPTHGGVSLDGAAAVAVSSVEECMEIITKGNANRAVSSTGMNAHSSRSHAVLIARIERKEFATATGSASASTSGSLPSTHVVKMSNLFLVDLAGSERVKKAKVYGHHVNELKAINLSLSALGNCISALSRQQPQRHVPYRDSKLTRLLSSSLGGNAKTALVITVSPSPTEASETLSTLQFGQRAMKVCVQAYQNVMSVLDYKSLYEDTQQRLDEARASNQQVEAELMSHLAAQRTAEDQLLKAQLRIQHLEFECQASKVQQNSHSSSSSNQQLATEDGGTEANQLAQQVAVLVQQHEHDITAIKTKCDLQVETYKRLAEEAQQEWHELEDQLSSEKQQVLASLLELKEFKMRFFELEDTSTDRIAELVSEDTENGRERKYEQELAKQRLIAQEKTIAELQQKLLTMEQREQQLREQMEVEYVPKETIKQMETLYESAISRLQARVGSLEQRSSTGSKKGFPSSGNQESDSSSISSSSISGRTGKATAPLPAVSAPPGGKAIPKIGRLMPAAKANSLR